MSGHGHGHGHGHDHVYDHPSSAGWARDFALGWGLLRGASPCWSLRLPRDYGQLARSVSAMYNLYMSRQMAMSEVRRVLPALLKEVERDGTTVDITKRGAIVARLVGPLTDAVGTAEALLSARRTLGRQRKPRVDVSMHKNEYLTKRHA